ncbi:MULTISPECIES: anthranilate synthase component II [Herpetosiphon]|uniref:anthranilate synthase component II n=1 Tax=Herpetosiphon TaxID=64 RepID=UPI0019567FDE|nr:aminodeoxychorismate/anthranilate synthase component II [Herpetosiphon giganteus]MBM7845816.1 anthranilate synthase component 2 [Herpetosiphon giganteus]
MAVLLLDNYDSFTYNLYQYFCELGAEVVVKRNDEIEVDDIRTMETIDRIVISPGPCTPAEAGISVPLIRELCMEYPILGVCLGHQSIGAAFGGRVIRAPQLRHGKTSPITHLNVGIFAGVPSPFTATRYHSLIVEEASLPSDLEATAWSDDGLIMGLRHRSLPIEGVQFHPESIMTEHGKALLANFLSIPKPELAESKSIEHRA